MKECEAYLGGLGCVEDTNPNSVLPGGENNLSQEVIRDAELLEKEISSLVDAFEAKHKPFQVRLISRVRNYRDKYKVSKGGSAQVILQDCSPMAHLGLPVRSLTDTYTNPDNHIFYTDDEVGYVPPRQTANYPL